MKPEERYQHYYNEGYNAGSLKGYEQAIDDAVKWLDCYIDNYLFIDIENNAGIKWNEFINAFRKAMKGE